MKQWVTNYGFQTVFGSGFITQKIKKWSESTLLLKAQNLICYNVNGCERLTALIKWYMFIKAFCHKV